jgi:hypothetical protein
MLNSHGGTKSRRTQSETLSPGVAWQFVMNKIPNQEMQLLLCFCLKMKKRRTFLPSAFFIRTRKAEKI